MKTLNRQRRLVPDRRAAHTRLWLETLENRTLMSVDVSQVFEGLSYSNDPRYEPPDTIAAAGPTYIVEVVNGSVGYFDKATGTLTSLTRLEPFFAPLGSEATVNDPTVAYDSITSQFLVASLDYNFSSLSRVDLAVSNDSDPNDGWTFARYNMNDGVGGFDFADQPKLGFNADGYFFSCNMFAGGYLFDHVDILSIDQTTLTGYRYQVPGGTAHFSMVPATENDASPGAAEYFVEAALNSGSAVQVDYVYNPFSDTPDLTTTSLPVDPYRNPPSATQPGGSINTDDDRIESVALTDNLLVAAHTIGNGNVAQARWYEFDITNDNPTLVQSGNIDQGPGVNTYYPSIEINLEYDLGMTFMESSPAEYMSMYVAGQNASDFGTGMQTPVVTHAGTANYTGGRAGDFSGITVDPADGITFWAANEYRGGSFWNTGIAGFTVSPADGGSGLHDLNGSAGSQRGSLIPADASVPARTHPNTLVDGAPVSPPWSPFAVTPVVDWHIPHALEDGARSLSDFWTWES